MTFNPMVALVAVYDVVEENFLDAPPLLFPLPLLSSPFTTSSSPLSPPSPLLPLFPLYPQFPQELVTYGGNGQVFSNWAQFWLTMHYLSVMEEDQTLVMYSGHPMGLFPSHPQAPRCVITNGMVHLDV